MVDVNIREDCVHSSVFDSGNEYLYIATAFIFLIREGSDNLITKQNLVALKDW